MCTALAMATLRAVSSLNAKTRLGIRKGESKKNITNDKSNVKGNF